MAMKTSTGTNSTVVELTYDTRPVSELATLLRELEWRPARSEPDIEDYMEGCCHFCNGSKYSHVTVLPDSPSSYKLLPGQHDTWCQWLRLSNLVRAVFGDTSNGDDFAGRGVDAKPETR
jgi:hypothetical protein